LIPLPSGEATQNEMSGLGTLPFLLPDPDLSHCPSLFIKSASVAVQAVTVISVSVLADVGESFRASFFLPTIKNSPQPIQAPTVSVFSYYSPSSALLPQLSS
jgi:hypothetical protein